MSEPVRAVLIDLDDTLYPQAEFLAAAVAAVAAAGADRGLDPAALTRALGAALAGGSDRGAVIDRALAAIGAPAELVPPLVEAFRDVRPAVLRPYPGVAESLGRLAASAPLALITDGHPPQQRAKLAATGLEAAFDFVVCTDEFGRACRKPAPLGFRTALTALDTEARDAVMVGDRPDKDVVGAAALGIRAVRVRQGEHAHQPDGPAWRTVTNTPDALDLVAALAGARL